MKWIDKLSDAIADALTGSGNDECEHQTIVRWGRKGVRCPDCDRVWLLKKRQKA